jgi:hypothetical protein
VVDTARTGQHCSVSASSCQQHKPSIVRPASHALGLTGRPRGRQRLRILRALRTRPVSAAGLEA